MTSFIWRDCWRPTQHDAPHSFDAADSWRHSRGRAAGLELHRRRFAASTGALPPGLWEGALDLLDPTLELFPRISVCEGEFRFDIRPAPDVRMTTDLTVCDAPDPRTSPLIKGPDLHRLLEHKRSFAAAGTDDVVLGDFAETTTGALVGWNGPTLVVPAAVHLPSTTEALVVERARSAGARVVRGQLTMNRPIWFLNALHGISPVRQIVRCTRGDEKAAGAADVFQLPRRWDEDEWRRWWWNEAVSQTVRD